ncbi:glucosamine--fructose-6-phosphate aminotransferase (isomerizing) [Elusimicrobium posterum]|uniref:glutamine--fructose-6-phosphate transaminase (isomerizing) n=1 Tax=Elusimicrobium posterum TaxID=3116653 RepID=UPI003C76DAF6
MCGIIGYSGKQVAANIVIEGLKKLEYRGYDSAGIASIENGELKRLRAPGKVKALEDIVSNSGLSGTTAIGHTRWATHGIPSEENSHPHTDCSGTIAVVHNGIIENYLELKDELKKKGHNFKSETDSEVVAHLIEENLKIADAETPQQKLLFSARQTINQITGAFALGIVWTELPDTIVGIRKQSPLVAGQGEDENFIASDVTAFLNHTKKAIFLEDNEILFLDPYQIKVFNLEGELVHPKITTIKWDNKQAEKGGYKHFMLKEIFEQPDALADTLRFGIEEMPNVFGITQEECRQIKSIQIIACGTAYHAGLCAKYFIENFADIPTNVDFASEYKYRHVPKAEGTLAVAISQSGETADTIAGVRKAKGLGYKVLAICNVLGSTLTRLAEHTFFTRCGLEISVASTKAFTSQLAALYGLALFLGKENGTIKQEDFGNLIKEFFALPRLVEEATKVSEAAKEIAKKFYKEKTFVFLGRGPNFPIALEGALKLKEISYLHAEGFAGGEIKHGPIAIIDKNVPVFAVLPKDDLFEKMISSCEETKARGASVIAITDENGAKTLEGKLKHYITIPNTTKFLSPVLSAVVVQFLAYYIADYRKCEIDQPRNLAKSVTVE